MGEYEAKLCLLRAEQSLIEEEQEQEKVQADQLASNFKKDKQEMEGLFVQYKCDLAAKNEEIKTLKEDAKKRQADLEIAVG